MDAEGTHLLGFPLLVCLEVSKESDAGHLWGCREATNRHRCIQFVTKRILVHSST